MNTFLPYPEFDLSAFCLDWRRLGKQRLECLQMCRAVQAGPYSCRLCRKAHSGFCERCTRCGGEIRRTPYWWHPATQMWIGHVPALARFGLECCREWKARGYRDSLSDQLQAFLDGPSGLPWWHGDFRIHESWQSRLIQKDPVYYRRLFGDVPDDLPQVWPTRN